MTDRLGANGNGGAGSDGRLTPQYEAHCSICGQGVLGLGKSRTGAIVELVEHYGWRLLRGLWTCGDCPRDRTRQ